MRLAPPGGARGRRARGTYAATAKGTNIVAASVEAYIAALNGLLAEAHWAGATEAAGNARRARTKQQAQPAAEFDEAAGKHDTTAWFER